MYAAPLDGRDDTGDGGTGSGSHDHHDGGTGSGSHDHHDGGTGSGSHDHHDGGTSEGSRRLPAAAGLLGVLVGLVALLWLLSLTDDGGINADSQDSEVLDTDPFEVPTTSSPLREPEGIVEVAPEAEEVASAASAEPFSDLEGWIVYLSGNQVARLDLSTGAVERLSIAAHGSFHALTDLTMLTDGKRTVALALDHDPPIPLLVASDALVVPSTDPLVDFWVISRPRGPDGAIRLNGWQDYGLLTGELRAPPSSELLVIEDVDVLVNPPVGGTFRPTFTGFQAVSEHRLLAGRGGLVVEQRCDERLACGVVAVDATTGQATELPLEFVAEIAGISVSPNGRWLLNDTSPAWLFDLDTGALRLLDVGGYGRPQWSDDSAWVAWLTTDQTPTLVVALTEPPGREKGWLVVELAGLGADPSPGTSFLLDPTLSRR